MPAVKKRYAYGVEFTAPELIAVSGRTSTTVRTWMRDAHGDMEEVCEKCGFYDAESLIRALSIIREADAQDDAPVMEFDEQMQSAVEEICDILGIADEEDAKGETIMEKKCEAIEEKAPEKNDDALLLFCAFRSAAGSVKALSKVLGDTGEDEVFANQMGMLADLIEAKSVNVFQQFITMDWDAVEQRLRASCS